VRTDTASDTVIIGAGPAGIAAAVQLSRHGVAPVVVEKAEPGGLLRTAWLVENLPGFPNGISGPALAALLKEQLRASGAELVREEVVALRRVDELFICETNSGSRLYRTAIVASGTLPRHATGVRVEAEAEERVLREVAKLWGIEGKHVVILGGGDAAFDYAQGLSEKNDVTIVMRRTRARCLPPLERRARASGRVALRASQSISRISASEGDAGPLTVLIDGQGVAPQKIDADYVVLAIGREPNDGFVSEELGRNERELGISGEMIFAGDVASGIFRQVSIAAGEGTLAAMRVAHRLRQLAERAEGSRGNGGAERGRIQR
jgi:thioredoxin reductase (NADPH)